jgi:hypothetical protein
MERETRQAIGAAVEEVTEGTAAVLTNLSARVFALEEVMRGMGEEIDDLTKRIDVIEARFETLHATGAIDIPAEVEDITHLRARGTIRIPVRWEEQP